MSGSLTVSILAVRNIKDEDDLLNSNDLYVIIKLGHEKFESEVFEGAGSSYQFDTSKTTKTFDISQHEAGHTDLFIEFYDQDTFDSDGVGKVEISVGGVIATHSHRTSYPVQPKGEVEIEFQWSPTFMPSDQDQYYA